MKLEVLLSNIHIGIFIVDFFGNNDAQMAKSFFHAMYVMHGVEYLCKSGDSSLEEYCKRQYLLSNNFVV